MNKMYLTTERARCKQVVKKAKEAVAATNRIHLVLLISLALATCINRLQAQKNDSLFAKKKLKESDIELLLSYYTQDGIHSAVTGGEGTEFLQVYSAQVNYSQAVDQRKTYTFHLGTDLISSASTDRIDFVMSSASRKDLHTTLALGYAQKLKNANREVGGGLMFSLESDYASIGGELWGSHISSDKTLEITAGLQAFFDDLRWGRLKKPYIVEAQTLVYPQELRGINWYNTHNRYSYNFTMSIRKDLNKKMSLNLYPAYTYQEGLLATPFHRIYFVDVLDIRVENLPQKRNQLAMGVQLNSFVSKRMVLRTLYQYYTDDFGLSSNLLKLEIPVKISPKWSISPFVRYLNQQGSRYFKPYKEHHSSSVFYTSDYDLSTFWSANMGINLNLTRSTSYTHKYRPAGLAFRYSYYHRSDGLYAHIFSTYIGLGRSKTKFLKP